MRKTFVMRGQTAKGLTEVLNFGKYKAGYAYRLTEFTLYPSLNIGAADAEMCAVITAGKTPLDPQNPNFNDDGLIGSTLFVDDAADHYPASTHTVINDTFIITQNLLLTVFNSKASPINWQCRFESVKMTGSEEAAVNYKQFAISDE